MEKKKTLLQKVKDIRNRTILRRDQLQCWVDEYKESGDFENAMKNDIKKKQYDLFLNEIETLLKK